MFALLSPSSTDNKGTGHTRLDCEWKCERNKTRVSDWSLCLRLNPCSTNWYGQSESPVTTFHGSHSLTHLVLEKEWNEPKWGERATGEWTERRVRRTEEQSKPRINRIWWVLFSALSPFPTLIPALCFSLLFHWLFSCVHFAFACSLPQPNEHEWNKGGMSGEWVKGRAQRSQVEPYEHTNARECLTVPVDSKG